mmetsp:Transcript_9729/g.12787  ORF Transcript_9729/g.12787 Transcript_9729/m.12787 type:complete len:562 (+) Transcript_9729:20-1705(+)
MGDSVEQILERQIPALRDLIDRRLMTSEEVKGLVDQRRQFEYRLQRRASRKVDFIRYVEFELKVDSLRRIRKRRLSLKKKTISDFAQISHCFFIFERAVRKFQGDPNMWQQFIDFAIKQKAEKRLSTLFPRALQMHPRNAALWIRAASWQYFELGNATTARVLLQRSLRINPREKSLWLEYFRVEMHYILKVSTRREVLGLSSQDLQAKFAVPLAIFRNAIKEQAQDLSFRADFIKLSEEFENSSHLKDTVIESIASDFPTQDEAWLLRAQMASQTDAHFSIAIFEEGVAAIPDNSAMWSHYAQFLLRLHNSRDSDETTDGLLACDDVYRRASAVGAMTVEMYLAWSKLVLPESGPHREVTILRASLNQYKTSPLLWTALISVSSTLFDEVTVEQLIDMVAEAVSALGDKSDQQIISNIYQPLLERAIAQCVKSGNVKACGKVFLDCFSCSAIPPIRVCCQFLNWSFSTSGVEGVRHAFHEVKQRYVGHNAYLVPVAMEFVRVLSRCATQESIAEEVRNTFEFCVLASHSESLFNKYINFELSIGELDRASSLRWRLSNNV